MDMRNHVVLTGYLGKDPKTANYHYTPKGKEEVADQLIELSIGTNYKKTVTWHTAVGYGENFVSHLGDLKKGSKVQINGYLVYEKVTKGDDTKTYTKVIIQGFELMNGAAKSGKVANAA